MPEEKNTSHTKLEAEIGALLNESSDIDHMGPEEDLMIERAVATANYRTGSRDLLALGIASIWIVLASFIVNVLKNRHDHKIIRKNDNEQ